jgi:CDP-diglyceride synthetase
MHAGLIFEVLVLLLVANGTPILAKRLLGDRLSHSLDGGLVFFDGRPVFGHSKTLRGVVLALLITSVAAPIMGVRWQIGALVACAAMAGDLISSFIKRRANLPPGALAIGLDHIPESALPVLICWALLPLTFLDMVAVVALFLASGLLLSGVFNRMPLGNRPIDSNHESVRDRGASKLPDDAM